MWVYCKAPFITFMRSCCGVTLLNWLAIFFTGYLIHCYESTTFRKKSGGGKALFERFGKSIKGTGFKVTGTESFAVISCEILLCSITKEYGWAS